MSDIPTWNLAVGAWLTGDPVMTNIAKQECLALVRGTPSGSPLSGSEYQHIEHLMLDTALVVDCCFDAFSASERDEVSNFINGAMSYSEDQDATFWPFGDPHNNYWNNQHLALSVVGICCEGWNTQAGIWRQKFEARCERFSSKYSAPFYSGPQATEGHYYSSYIRNSLWAMRQYDAVLGSSYMNQFDFNIEATLNLALHQLRPHNAAFFHIGSEAANANAPFHSSIWSLWYQLIASAPTSIDARVAKAILNSPEVASDSNNNFWSRSSKAFVNFFWSINSVAEASLSAKSDRKLTLPTPGGAMTHLRSQQGWDTTATRRAAVIFHQRTAWRGEDYPGYSHANVDAPGFQWCQDDQWLVIDPEFYGKSGIDGERGGSTLLSDLSNIVTLSSAKFVSDGNYPALLFDEDNTNSSVPHYYLSVDAQPYWTMCAIYRREYVWLDDLQVVVVFDRVATSGSDVKTWRLHVDGAPTIRGNLARLETKNGTALSVYDLFTSGGNGMTASNIQGDGSIASAVYRLSQTSAANDFISLKVLSVNDRVSDAILVQPNSGEYEAVLTIAGTQRRARFFDSGNHARIS